MREFNFDGLVGPTHNYSGLSDGNLACFTHKGKRANPKAAALQGITKMRHLLALGVPQAVLPPQERPHVPTLRALGFTGTDAQVMQRVLQQAPGLLSLVCSASSMWTANAATVAPALDTIDAKTHLTVANLAEMFHRQIEADTTYRVLQTVFANERFNVHRALPASRRFGDEGAANHTRLSWSAGALHLFAWGRDGISTPALPKHPVRQTLAASEAVSRLNALPPERCLFWRQAPAGIDAGGFHTDVLAVGNDNFLMFHEHAFVDPNRFLETLKQRTQGSIHTAYVTQAELPAQNAVQAYPFNSQVVRLPSGKMHIVAPLEAQQDSATCRFLERVISEENPVAGIDYLDLRQSMANGGGPACLRLRVPLSTADEHALTGATVMNGPRLTRLETWVEQHYRDALSFEDLADPALLRESRCALDELTQLLELGSIYEFQR